METIEGDTMTHNTYKNEKHVKQRAVVENIDKTEVLKFELSTAGY